MKVGSVGIMLSLLLLWIPGCAPEKNGTEDNEKPQPSGAELYSTYCSACHGGSGEGQGEIFPPLTGSDFLADKNRTIDAVVNGLQGEISVNGVKYNGIMPPLPDAYSDEAVASVINYMMQTFGDTAWQTTAEEVAGIRH